MFQKLKNALKGGPNSNSTKSGSTPDVPLAAFDKKWGIARVALHSVPSQIQSVAYDCVQGVVALGSNNGMLYLYGRYGVDYVYFMPPSVSIRQLEFAVNQGWLIGVCVKVTQAQQHSTIIEGYSLCMWNMKTCALQFQIEMPKVGRITCIHCPIGSSYCYMGLQMLDGSCAIRAVNVSNGELSKTVCLVKPTFDQANTLQPVTHVDCVTSIETHPLFDQYLLVGYESGDVAVFNLVQHFIQKSALVFRTSSTLGAVRVTSVSWHPKGAFFIAATTSNHLLIYNFDQIREKQLNSNSSMIYVQPDIQITSFDAKAIITYVSCLHQNAYVSVQHLDDETQSMDGIYNLVFPPTWLEASSIKVLHGTMNQFILMPSLMPHKCDFPNSVSFGGVITASGSFQIVNLQRESEHNSGFTIGNFLNEDATDSTASNQPTSMTIIKNVEFVDKIFKQRRGANTSFPLFGGDIDFKNSWSTSHLIAVKYNDGSANVWAVKSDMGALAKVFGVKCTEKSVLFIDSWSNEAFIFAFSDGSVQFLSTRTLKWFPVEFEKVLQYLDENLTVPVEPIAPPLYDNSGNSESSLENVNSGNVTFVTPVQFLNRMIIAYNCGRLDIVDLTGDIHCVLFSYSPCIDNEEIMCAEVVFAPSKDSTDTSWYAYVGLSSGRIVCVDIEKHNQSSTSFSKFVNNCTPPAPIRSGYGCVSIDSLDESLDIFPCIEPCTTDLPYYIQEQLQSGGAKQSIFGINNYAKVNKQSFVPSDVKLFNIDQKGFVCPLTIQISLNPHSGLRLMNGEVDIRLVGEDGSILFWAEVHPLKVLVGHLPQNATSTADLVEVEFDYDLQNIILDGAKTVSIIHDVAQKKYRIFNDANLAGVQSYEEDPPKNSSLKDVKVSVKGTAPSNMDYDSHDEYVQDYVRSITLNFKSVVAVQDINSSSADVMCVWQEDIITEAIYLVCLREQHLQLIRIKSNKELKRLHSIELPSKVVSGGIISVNYKLYYSVLCQDGHVRIFTLPQLQLCMSKSIDQSHLCRYSSPTVMCIAEQDQLLFASEGVLLQASIVPETPSSTSVVIEPTFYAQHQMPVKSSKVQATPQVVNQVLGGLQQLGGFLFGTNQPAQITQVIDRSFDVRLQEFFERLPERYASTHQHTLIQKDYETSEYEKQYASGNKRRLFGHEEPLRIKQIQPQFPSQSPPQSSNQANVEPKSQDEKLTKLLAGPRSGGRNEERSSESKSASLQQRTNEARNAMQESLQKLDERGERLRNVEQRSSDLALAAQNFAANAAKLKKQNNTFGFF